MAEPRRILVVEDDAMIRMLYGEIFSDMANGEIPDKRYALFGGQDAEAKPNDQDRRYDLTLVERGRDAVRAVQEAVKEGRPFAVAFIDFYMLDIDGMETARQIRQEEPDIKIVMVSGKHRESPGEIEMQDTIWLQKPFAIEDVKRLAHTLTTQWISERGSPD